MSFYMCIKTEIKNRIYLKSALAELHKRGEIQKIEENERKGKIIIDRGGDKLVITGDEEKGFEVGGDATVVKAFTDRLKQVYAVESIKDNLPLDLEVVEETESATGEIHILLKD